VKFIIVSITVFFFSMYCLAGSAEMDAISILLKHSERITTVIDSLKIKKGQKWPVNLEDVGMDSISTMLKKPQFLSTENGALLGTHVYLSYINSMIKIYNKSSVINDFLNINILANLLRSNNEETRDRALDKLLHRASFEALKDNSTQIKMNLQISKLSDSSKDWLLVLLILNEEEKVKILASKISLENKAAINDTALDSLISGYHNAKTDVMKRIYAENLLQTGKKQAVQAAIKELCEPIFDIRNKNVSVPCTSSNFQTNIIRGLKRYWPNDTLILLGLDNITDDVGNSQKSYNKSSLFWKEFVKWVEKNYGIELQTTIPYSTFLRGCGPQY
jgi:hypothetical protein